MDANRLGVSGVSHAVACEIAAHAALRASPEKLALLRRDPGMTVPASALRHVDDQSVAGLAAVLAALADSQRTALTCQEWGIVSAPRYLGRTSMIGALRRYRTEGAWGVSPHLVPQQSQHAVAGVVSQMLGIQGPSLGVGGGMGAGLEGAQTAATLLQADALPGVWLIVTGWDPEPTVNEQGRLSSQAICHALALGLTLSNGLSEKPRLEVRSDGMTTTHLDDAMIQAWFSRSERREEIS